MYEYAQTELGYEGSFGDFKSRCSENNCKFCQVYQREVDYDMEFFDNIPVTTDWADEGYVGAFKAWQFNDPSYCNIDNEEYKEFCQEKIFVMEMLDKAEKIVDGVLKIIKQIESCLIYRKKFVLGQLPTPNICHDRGINPPVPPPLNNKIPK